MKASFIFPRGKGKTEGGFGMVTGYRFTEDEFVFLAYLSMHDRSGVVPL